MRATVALASIATAQKIAVKGFGEPRSTRDSQETAKLRCLASRAPRPARRPSGGFAAIGAQPGRVFRDGGTDAYNGHPTLGHDFYLLLRPRPRPRPLAV